MIGPTSNTASTSASSSGNAASSSSSFSSSISSTSGSSPVAGRQSASTSITVCCQCALADGKPNISYTVFPSTLISQVLESSSSHFGLDPKANDVGLLCGGIICVPSLTCSDYHICTSRTDKAASPHVLELVRLSEVGSCALRLQVSSSCFLTSLFHCTRPGAFDWPGCARSVWAH